MAQPYRHSSDCSNATLSYILRKRYRHFSTTSTHQVNLLHSIHQFAYQISQLEGNTSDLGMAQMTSSRNADRALRTAKPLYFTEICELFDNFDRDLANALRDDVLAVRRWFDKYASTIPRNGPAAVAFLSCLFPERRADRLCKIKETRLEGILQSALGLGATRIKDSRRWREADSPNFTIAVQSVIAATDESLLPQPKVTIVEVDQMLDRVASGSVYSSDGLQQKFQTPIRVSDELSAIFRRLHSSEAKWRIRLLPKNFSPVHIPEKSTLRCFHFLLPGLLQF